jgi:hypothetical protein
MDLMYIAIVDSYRLWNWSKDSLLYGILEGNTNSCPHFVMVSAL